MKVSGNKFNVSDEIYYIYSRLDLRKSTIKHIEFLCYGSGSILEFYIFEDGSRVHVDKCYKTPLNFFEDLKCNFCKSIDKEIKKYNSNEENRSAIPLSNIVKSIIK